MIHNVNKIVVVNILEDEKVGSRENDHWKWKEIKFGQTCQNRLQYMRWIIRAAEKWLQIYSGKCLQEYSGKWLQKYTGKGGGNFR